MTQPSDREYHRGKDNSYTPLNIRMIRAIMGKGTPFSIGQTVVDQISLVAKLLSMNITAGVVEVELEDESGAINGRIFKRVDSDKIKPLSEFEKRIGEYVYVYGSLMNFSGNDVIIIGRMQNVDGYEWINLHRTQVFWAQLARKKLVDVNF
jgi:hypothetical protein